MIVRYFAAIMADSHDCCPLEPRPAALRACIQDFEVLEPKRSGKYETGIVRPTCGDIRLKHSEVQDLPL